MGLCVPGGWEQTGFNVLSKDTFACSGLRMEQPILISEEPFLSHSHPVYSLSNVPMK